MITRYHNNGYYLLNTHSLMCEIVTEYLLCDRDWGFRGEPPTVPHL